MENIHHLALPTSSGSVLPLPFYNPFCSQTHLLADLRLQQLCLYSRLIHVGIFINWITLYVVIMNKQLHATNQFYKHNIEQRNPNTKDDKV